VEQLEAIVTWLDDWRVRKLEATAVENLKQAPAAEAFTPALVRHD